MLLRSTYPATSAKAVTDVFMSPDTPKRSAAAKEIASFSYGDADGYHALFLLEVDDGKFKDFMQAQTARNAYMQSRVTGLRIEVIPGFSVPEALGLVTKHLAK
jgi:hypothetical protein